MAASASARLNTRSRWSLACIRRARYREGVQVRLAVKELVLSGTFAPLPAGATRGTVEAVLGPPDAVAGLTGVDIWLYGGLELTFHEGPLVGVFSDHLPLDLDEPRVDPWLFGGALPIALTTIEAALAAAGVRGELRARDPRWGDPPPPAQRVPVHAWDERDLAAIEHDRCTADLELDNGVTLGVGYHAATRSDGQRVATEDIIVSIARSWPGA